jgi:DNA polymerase-1
MLIPARNEVFDIETTGLKPYHGDQIFAYVKGTFDDLDIIRMNPGEKNQKLIEFLKNTHIRKITHNLKFELSFLETEKYDIPEGTIWHDTMIMSQLLRNLHHNHSLDFLVYELGGDPDRAYQKLEAKVKSMGAAYGNYQKIPENLMKEYQRADGERGLLLFHTFWPQIKNTALEEDYWNEIELIKAVQKMEQRGILLDDEGVQQRLSDCSRGMIEVEQEVERQFPNDYFNLSSPTDVIRLLYNKYNLPILKFTGTGQPSVDKETLSALRETHPCSALDWVQKYRSYQKGFSIITGYKELADSQGIVHPELGTNFAKTGRLNCRNPNLQNVSKPENLKNPYIISARGCYRSRPGYVLIDIDQSGIELRLIIEAADSIKMIQLMKEGKHPHVVACRLFFQDKFISKAESKALYSAGKNGHFCLCYGGGLPKFAGTIGMSIEEAEPGYEAYCQEFPEIANLANGRAHLVRRTGYITTPFHRKLQLPHGKHYAWLNYYIQGTAAGIIKRGIVAVHKYLRKHWPDDGHLLMTVHDSIIMEFREKTFFDNQIQIFNEVSQLMVNIPNIKVPLEVEWELSRRRWDESKPFRPEIQKGENRRHRVLYNRKSRIASKSKN